MILHIIPSGVWERAQGGDWFFGDTLEAEGFIHFSKPSQTERVANAHFRGHTGLLLLVVDPTLLTSELRFEPPYESPGRSSKVDASAGELFPHLYGPLNLKAVVDVLPFEPQPDGSFLLPETLRLSS